MYANTLNQTNKKKWASVRSLIEVQRAIITKGKLHTETAYFISDLPSNIGAKYFYKGIRSHWQIETFHYIKDITFLEDHWKVRTKNAPANYSLMRNVAINIFRHHGLHRIQEAIEQCANNVPFMMTLL